MKRLIVLGIYLCVCSCHEKTDPRIFGLWEVKNRFYHAIYQIKESDGKIVGEVRSYDDGTTSYTWDSTRPKYIIHDLKPKDGQYVDAITGATPKPENINLKLRVKHEDTLQATLFIHNHPTPEIWVRKK